MFKVLTANTSVENPNHNGFLFKNLLFLYRGLTSNPKLQMSVSRAARTGKRSSVVCDCGQRAMARACRRRERELGLLLCFLYFSFHGISSSGLQCESAPKQSVASSFKWNYDWMNGLLLLLESCKYLPLHHFSSFFSWSWRLSCVSVSCVASGWKSPSC